MTVLAVKREYDCVSKVAISVEPQTVVETLDRLVLTDIDVLNCAADMATAYCPSFVNAA